MRNMKKLTDMQIDVLGEIGNIGSGNAATALSELLGHPINIDVPEVIIMDYDNVMEMLGGPEEIISAVLEELSGDLNGIMLFIQEKDFVETVLSSLMQKPIDDFSEMDEMDKSAIVEVGNILMASYMNAVGDMTGLHVDNGVPSHTVNMAGAILTVPLISVAETYDYVVLIRANFLVEDNSVSSNIFMVLDMDSLNKMLDQLGVGMD
ncbi:MAG: chemotaxis protein CheC [Clostridia bacterium]|nr:chemotaxis protein CheC [Clostridia bacterium]